MMYKNIKLRKLKYNKHLTHEINDITHKTICEFGKIP